MRSLVAWPYTGPRIVLPLAAVVIAAIGTLDSFADTDGTRVLGALPFIAPGLVSLVHCLLILRRETPTGRDVTIHFLTSAFVVALPVVIVDLLFLIGAWLVPANQALVGSDAQNAWWPGSVGTQSVIMVFGGIFGQIGGALIAFILVVLPVIAIRRPRVIAQGGALEKIADTKIGKAAILSLVLGISAAFIGGLMVAFTRGLDIGDLGYELSYMGATFGQLGSAPISQMIWAIGLLLTILGLAAIVFTIIVVSRSGKKSGD